MFSTRILMFPRVDYHYNFVLHGPTGSETFKNIAASKVHKYICEFFDIKTGSTEARLVNNVVTLRPLTASIHSSFGPSNSRGMNKVFYFEFEDNNAPIYKNKCFPVKEQYSQYRHLTVYDPLKTNVVDLPDYSEELYDRLKISRSYESHPLKVLFPYAKNIEKLSVIAHKQFALFAYINNLSDLDKEKIVHPQSESLTSDQKKSLGFMLKENVLPLSDPLAVETRLSLYSSLGDFKVYKSTTLIMVHKNPEMPTGYVGDMHQFFAKKE